MGRWRREGEGGGDKAHLVSFVAVPETKLGRRSDVNIWTCQIGKNSFIHQFLFEHKHRRMSGWVWIMMGFQNTKCAQKWVLKNRKKEIQQGKTNRIARCKLPLRDLPPPHSIVDSFSNPQSLKTLNPKKLLLSTSEPDHTPCAPHATCQQQSAPPVMRRIEPGEVATSLTSHLTRGDGSAPHPPENKNLNPPKKKKPRDGNLHIEYLLYIYIYIYGILYMEMGVSLRPYRDWRSPAPAPAPPPTPPHPPHPPVLWLSLPRRGGGGCWELGTRKWCGPWEEKEGYFFFILFLKLCDTVMVIDC